MRNPSDRVRALRFSLALLVPGVALFFAPPARAYCRATTCGAVSSAACPLDANGCATAGTPLSWSTACLSFAVDQAGSPKRGISYDVFDGVVRLALQQWLAVDCGGGRHPSIALWDAADFAGSLVCSKAEYNQAAPNANAWILRDDAWPYTDTGSEFAHTTVTFDAASGRILDADVEINSHGVELTTSDDVIVADLQSIATHEAGHFLGLADSADPDATMSRAYSPASRKARSLSSDDKAAICALYPPDRDVPACSDPSPNHGYSRYCAGATSPPGCALTRAASPPSSSALLAATGALFWASHRRRATRHRCSCGTRP